MKQVKAWARREIKRRRNNPQSVLDVMPDGASVPWSELRATFPQVFAQYKTDVDARIAYMDLS